jgi:hypothetical protein
MSGDRSGRQNRGREISKAAAGMRDEDDGDGDGLIPLGASSSAFVGSVLGWTRDIPDSPLPLPPHF